MSRQTIGFDVSCDAPAYAIVQACQWLGLQRPLDVAWYHRARFRRAHQRIRGFLGIVAWLFGRGEPAAATCRCGQALPELDHCLVTLGAARDDVIRLGQCGHCHTIFWDQS